MRGENRPNYFLLLGIDPDDEWDQAAFESRLRARRAEWSRAVLNGVQGSRKVLTAEDARHRLTDIRSTMSDPARRERERKDARERRAAESSDRLAAFEGDLRIMMIKGFLWEAEADVLRRDYADLMADVTVAERIETAPQHSFAELRAVPDQLASSLTNEIRDLLDSLGEASLYTLLATVSSGSVERATRERLYDAARALYDQTQRDMNKHDPRLHAKQALAGHALQVFSTAENRARYDNTLALTPVTNLIARYRTALSQTRRLETSQVEQFIAEAAAKGADSKIARAMLLKHFEDQGWTVALPPEAPWSTPDEHVSCGACQARNVQANEFCAVCGARLRIVCPGCGTTVPGHGACATCGFVVGDHDWARLLIRECAESLDRDDLDGAEEKLTEAARAWPSDGEDEPLAVSIRHCRTRVERLRGERDAENDATARQLRSLVRQRNYQAALNKANSTRPTVPDRESVIQESKDNIGKADSLCDAANRHDTSTRQQVDYYTLALTHCADHARARRGLAALPPEPPCELSAEPVGRGVRLAWEPSVSDDVRYVVVRKEGAVPPASVSDGTRVATVRQTVYEDTRPETGVPLYYAVFARRPTGTVSEQAATSRRPVFRTGRVEITAQRVDDGVVELEWRLPANATGVTVRRTAGGETTDVHVTEPGRLRDVTVTNEESYTYTVRAHYAGTDELSAGTAVTLVPGRLPASPGPVHVRTVTRNLGLCYRFVDLLPQGAEPGTARVLWTQDRLDLQPGEQRPITELAAYGSLLTETEARGFALPRQGLYYFAQVVVRHGTGHLGAVRRYAAREEIGEVAARKQGDTLRLTWTWPEGCTAALVAWDHDGPPTDPTVAPHRVLVERDGDDRTGDYDADGTTPGREQAFHFLVAAAERRDGELFVAGGTRAEARFTPKKQHRSRRPQRRRG
ncbi:hypothetical protein GCM10022254_32530 [Actinomadura meridiana]|uniref:Fibronectin type-III domain-containing protein n=1 Tax=Actinomadura meridiana TaxID=559626 RepID=A0ABP8C2F5_9ACTN